MDEKGLVRGVQGLQIDRTHHSLAPDHAKVEFVLILAGSLLAELGDPILLRVKVASTLDVVCMLLKQSELLSPQGLRSFAVQREGREQAEISERFSVESS